MEDDLLALARRRMIFGHISANPGTYLREMEVALDLSVGDLQYHLGQLEKGGLITTNDDGKRKGYFVASEVPFFDRKVISIIRMKTPRHIIIFLLAHPDSSFTEILGNFSFTKSALSFQLKRLVGSGMVARARREAESIYRVVEPDKVGKLLMTYRASIADDVLDGVVDLLSRL